MNILVVLKVSRVHGTLKSQKLKKNTYQSMMGLDRWGITVRWRVDRTWDRKQEHTTAQINASKDKITFKKKGKKITEVNRLDTYNTNNDDNDDADNNNNKLKKKKCSSNL